MFLVLTIQYNSLLKPMVIMAAVPLGMIGVLIGLLVTGWAMGFMAMLGILSLGGIVINNAIILVDFIESNVAQGQELRQAVAEALCSYAADHSHHADDYWRPVTVVSIWWCTFFSYD
jgi:multidrug efflux pump subunit AcrB